MRRPEEECLRVGQPGKASSQRLVDVCIEHSALMFGPVNTTVVKAVE